MNNLVERMQNFICESRNDDPIKAFNGYIKNALALKTAQPARHWLLSIRFDDEDVFFKKHLPKLVSVSGISKEVWLKILGNKSKPGMVGMKSDGLMFGDSHAAMKFIGNALAKENVLSKSKFMSHGRQMIYRIFQRDISRDGESMVLAMSSDASIAVVLSITLLGGHGYNPRKIPFKVIGSKTYSVIADYGLFVPKFTVNAGSDVLKDLSSNKPSKPINTNVLIVHGDKFSSREVNFMATGFDTKKISFLSGSSQRNQIKMAKGILKSKPRSLKFIMLDRSFDWSGYQEEVDELNQTGVKVTTGFGF